LGEGHGLFKDAARLQLGFLTALFLPYVVKSSQNTAADQMPYPIQLSQREKALLETITIREYFIFHKCCEPGTLLAILLLDAIASNLNENAMFSSKTDQNSGLYFLLPCTLYS